LSLVLSRKGTKEEEEINILAVNSQNFVVYYLCRRVDRNSSWKGLIWGLGRSPQH